MRVFGDYACERFARCTDAAESMPGGVRRILGGFRNVRAGSAKLVAPDAPGSLRTWLVDIWVARNSGEPLGPLGFLTGKDRPG